MARRFVLPRRFSGPLRSPIVAAISTVTFTWVAVAPAGEVTGADVYRQGDRLLVDVMAADLLDERTTMTVDSGLPGTCVYHLRIEDRQHRAVVDQWVEMSLRLDLWEGVYLLEGTGAPRSFPTLAAADSAWSRIRGHGLVAIDRLQAGAEYRLKIGLAVQPLAPEDRERLSRYVSRNSGGAGEEVALDVGKVFSRLFRGSGGDASVESHVGEFFRLEDLEVRP